MVCNTTLLKLLNIFPLLWPSSLAWVLLINLLALDDVWMLFEMLLSTFSLVNCSALVCWSVATSSFNSIWNVLVLLICSSLWMFVLSNLLIFSWCHQIVLKLALHLFCFLWRLWNSHWVIYISINIAWRRSFIVLIN